MKDNKRKYLIVDACNVECKYKKSGEETNKETSIKIEELFKRKNIPSEYHKIMIMMCVFDFCINGDACEYVTGFPFDITGNRIKKEGKKKIVTGTRTSSVYRGLEKGTITQSVVIKTPLEYVGYEEIMNFYKKMKDDGYAYDYIKVLNEFFNLNIDLDFIFELHSKGEKSSKIKKLYKQTH